MANPRQRRKSRSGSHRAISHAKHAKRNLKKTPRTGLSTFTLAWFDFLLDLLEIRGPKVLQESWDSNKTVKQNYAALGLVHDLNPSASGGVEPIEDTPVVNLPSARPPPTNDGPQASTCSSSTLPKGQGRIIRDEAGNILRVELSEDDGQDEHPGGDVDMEMLEVDLDQSAVDKWVTDLGGSQTRTPIGKDGEIVQALQRISVPTGGTGTTISASLTGVGPRHAAHGELGYLRRLLDKHGNNVDQMARDRKLNPEQRTVGELGRALKRAGMA